MKVTVRGHFGEWVQGQLGSPGPLALVTLACPALWVDCTRLDDGPLVVEDPMSLVPDPAAFLARVGGQPGRYRLDTNMHPGGGAGASTAALVALARAAQGDESRLTAACLATEGATDPLMLDAPDRVLWASREGRSIADLPPLPPAEIVGGYWGLPQRTDPKDIKFPDVSDLAEAFYFPMPLDKLANIASLSARRCAALRGPRNDPIGYIAKRFGALGFFRAHTGSARGLIFAPGTVPAGVAGALRAIGCSGVLHFCTGVDL